MSERSVLGVDVGGTKIALCLMSENGKRSEVLRFPSLLRSGRDALAENILDCIGKALESSSAENAPVCVGVGLKDFVDNKNGVWVKSPSTPGFAPLPLAEMITERFGIPAVLDNDVHVAALAEQYYGRGRDFRDFVYMNVGTGIAIGVINDGRLMRGCVNYAGEIGHMSVDTDGELCPFCGQRGCLEEIAGGGAIISYARREMHNWPYSSLHGLEASGKLHSAAVFQEADLGDKFAGLIAKRTVHALAVACSAVVNIFNPEALIFGGGVMADGWLIEKIKDELPRTTIKTSYDSLREVCLSPLGSDYVGVLGAAGLGWEHIGKQGK